MRQAWLQEVKQRIAIRRERLQQALDRLDAFEERVASAGGPPDFYDLRGVSPEGGERAGEEQGEEERRPGTEEQEHRRFEGQRGSTRSRRMGPRGARPRRAQRR